MARILVVDDDFDILLVVESTLEASGHRVTTCSDPHDVDATVAGQSFEAIILDVMMPGLSGYDVLRKLRRHPNTQQTPILFLSARADSDARVRGLREGADDFLAKPFLPDELVLRIEQLASQRTVAAVASSPRINAPSNLQQTLQSRQVVGEVYLGRYQVLEMIGEGAMGLVFRGWDPRLKRQVALKTLRFEILLDDEEHRHKVAQLLLEASTGARFSHPNLVAVYDVGENAAVPFMAMEYVPGVSLADYLEVYGPLSSAQTIPLALAIAQGLDAAHSRQIVHQDIKPGNVLLGRNGTIKLTDFGVAKLLNAIHQSEKKLFGTPGFLPPEALRGQGCGERGDLFSLGSVLYECITGQEAFPGRTIRDRILCTLKHSVDDPRQQEPSIPDALADLILKLLAKDPDERPENAAAVVETLTAIDSTSPWAPDPAKLQIDIENARARLGPHHRSGATISTIDVGHESFDSVL